MASVEIPIDPIQKAVHRKDNFEEKSGSIIKKYSLITGGACLLPYTGLDIASSTLTQTLMVRELCQLYNVEYSERLMNIAAWSAVGSVLIKLIGELVTNLIPSSKSNKKIDFTGAAIGAIYTATLGEFYKLHLRDGGTLEDVSASDFVDYFVAEVQRGNLSIDSFTDPRKLINQFVLS